MGNVFNYRPKIMQLIVRVCIYHIVTYMEETHINYKKLFFKNLFLQIYRSQMENLTFILLCVFRIKNLMQ